jgi:hypothetical protein
MHPLVCCKEHNTNRHDIYDLCDTNEIGEVGSLASITFKLKSLFVHRRLCSITAGFINKRRSLRPTLYFEKPDGLTSSLMCAMMPAACQLPTILLPRNANATNATLNFLPHSMKSLLRQPIRAARRCELPGCVTNATLLRYNHHSRIEPIPRAHDWYPCGIVSDLLL